MATNLSTYNSSLATDPLRTFRFRAVFTPAGNDGVFDQRIKSATNQTAMPIKGVSTGWVGGFSTISGLNITTQNITYREGGFNTTVHQIPGMTTFQPITFTRGAIFGNDQAITWMRGLFAAAAGTGLNPGGAGATGAGFRVNIAIYVNNHPNTDVANDYPQMVFNVYNAWITNLSYSDLDATNGALMFETMQLVHEGLSVSFTDAKGNPVKTSGTSAVSTTGSGAAGGRTNYSVS